MRKILYATIVLAFLAACTKKETITPKQNDLKLSGSLRNCGELVVYQYGSYKGDSITFEVRSFFNELDTTNKKTVNYTLKKNNGVELAITTYKNYVPFSFCPGIVPKDYQPEPDKTWASESGIISMTVKEKLPSQPNYPMFKVDFELKNVLFKNEKGEDITIPTLLLNDVRVGGLLPG